MWDNQSLLLRENEITGLGAPASRRRDAGAPRQERGKHLQFPGIFMLCGAAPPHGDLRRLPLFLTAGWQAHATTWSVIRGPIGAWRLELLWCLELGIWSFHSSCLRARDCELLVRMARTKIFAQEHAGQRALRGATVLPGPGGCGGILIRDVQE